MKLHIGISTCPNDTFAFHAILNRCIDLEGLVFDVELLDIQHLNEGLRAGRFDYAKASFHAALGLAGKFGVLRAGSALGYGVGPLLLSATPRERPTMESRVLCPGADTTATLLMRCLHPEVRRIEQRLFSEIVPALCHGEADYGVVIHEGRFTYEREGLHCVEDLGERWERETFGPVPLGGILGRMALPVALHRRVNRVLVRSIRYAQAHRDEAFVTMLHHAQEMEPDVIWAHVDLYVNDRTLDLGAEGAAALATLQTLARRSGAIAHESPTLRILPPHT